MGNALSINDIGEHFNGFTDEMIQEAILKYITSTESGILDNILQISKKARKYTGIPRCKDFGSTAWGQMLANPATEDPTSYFGKKFRRRFRVPYYFSGTY